MMGRMNENENTQYRTTDSSRESNNFYKNLLA